MYVDTALSATETITPSTIAYPSGSNLTVGNGVALWPPAYDGHICELAIVNGAITDGEMTKALNLLAAKWGV